MIQIHLYQIQQIIFFFSNQNCLHSNQSIYKDYQKYISELFPDHIAPRQHFQTKTVLEKTLFSILKICKTLLFTIKISKLQK